MMNYVPHFFGIYRWMFGLKMSTKYNIDYLLISGISVVDFPWSFISDQNIAWF